MCLCVVVFCGGFILFLYNSLCKNYIYLVNDLLDNHVIVYATFAESIG